jgi:hypothetical protein
MHGLRSMGPRPAPLRYLTLRKESAFIAAARWRENDPMPGSAMMHVRRHFIDGENPKQAK